MKSNFLSLSTSVLFLLCGFTLHAQSWVQWDPAAGGNGHWYKAVINTNHFNWTQLDQIAHSEGGYLATITSSNENDFVFSLINAPEFFQGIGGNGSGPAIGGYQPNGSSEPAGGWLWETGEPWSYTAWAPGQPDNGGGVENRAHFWSGTQGVPTPTWNDLTADDQNLGGYIIERDEPLAPSRPGFFGQSFQGGIPTLQVHGTPVRSFISAYDSRDRLVRRIPTNPVGQFYAFVKPGEYTLVGTLSSRDFPPANISHWTAPTNSPTTTTVVHITVPTNQLTLVEINF
ncbi:MAG: hypothetical protein EPO07_09535 [Verrucomicrobia bacterium]|nr:MAG: hypothetical protein EPO07_09535 [Verrucomicrobiota bacterium]